ncbi:MAG: hypothetical protein IJ521_11935, partial [Schwartzia sp.]|nr:hypothetical protein [Schwartzia sp. (in: firmicutes)]
TYDRYADKTEGFGAFEAVFTDEPSLMAGYVNCGTPMPWTFVPWTEEMPEKWELRLSEAFGGDGSKLELVVTVCNINYAENREILEKCRDLKCYSIFVARVREAVKKGAPLKQAIADTIRYCKENDILGDYFAAKEQKEVIDMVSFKWDPEVAMKVRMEESWEKGLAEGRTASVTRFVTNLLKKHYPYEEISELADTTMKDVLRIAKETGLSYN